MSENESRVERIVAMTERLTEALEADIAALDRGKPAEMPSIAQEMQQLTSLYGREVASLKATRLNALPAPARATLTAATKRFHETLSLHGRRLSCVRNASEGMIRAIVEDVERKRRMTRTYAPGTTSPRAPGAMIYNGVV